MKLSKRQAEALGVVPLQAPGGPRAASGAKSDPEPARRAFKALCAAHGLPEPVPEYRFAQRQGRQWRADWIFDGWLIAEQEGGVWIKGRHTRGQGYLDDMEKYNAAVLLGYTVLRFTPQQFEDGSACAFIKKVLNGEMELS